MMKEKRSLFARSCQDSKDSRLGGPLFSAKLILPNETKWWTHFPSPFETKSLMMMMMASSHFIPVSVWYYTIYACLRLVSTINTGSKNPTSLVPSWVVSRAFSFLHSILGGRWTGDHSQEDLTNFGREREREREKVDSFWNPATSKNLILCPK
jgi:hypothetical protein